MDFIDLKSQQTGIREALEQRIRAVLDHGIYIMGPEVEELERALCAFVGVKHSIAVSSGTDSLLIALMALEVGPGDEVITTPYTWISTAEVIALLGAKTVFVDVQLDTWNIDPAQVAAAVNERTKAIMPVGIFGQTADMTEINRIAADAGGIPVIEDAAQSFGATHRGRNSCALSTVGSTSFFPSKPLGCYGDGGALFSDDDDLADRMRWIRVHGQVKKHYHPVLGLNGRLDTLQAAILLEKLSIFPDEVDLRQGVASRYDAGLRNAPGLEIPRIADGQTSVFAQYTVLCDNRAEIQTKLAANEVPSVAYYTVPLHLQPVFENLGYRKGDFPVAEDVSDRCLSLPMSPYLSAGDQEKVVASLLGE